MRLPKKPFQHSTVQNPVFFPGWVVECTKCERTIHYRCECIPVDAMFYEGPWENTHASDCELPERCPKCDMRNWTIGTKWRRGFGTSRSTQVRRRRKERELKEQTEKLTKLATQFFTPSDDKGGAK